MKKGIAAVAIALCMLAQPVSATVYVEEGEVRDFKRLLSMGQQLAGIGSECFLTANMTDTCVCEQYKKDNGRGLDILRNTINLLRKHKNWQGEIIILEKDVGGFDSFDATGIERQIELRSRCN